MYNHFTTCWTWCKKRRQTSKIQNSYYLSAAAETAYRQLLLDVCFYTFFKKIKLILNTNIIYFYSGKKIS